MVRRVCAHGRRRARTCTYSDHVDATRYTTAPPAPTTSEFMPEIQSDPAVIDTSPASTPFARPIASIAGVPPTSDARAIESPSDATQPEAAASVVVSAALAAARLSASVRRVLVDPVLKPYLRRRCARCRWERQMCGGRGCVGND